VYEEDNYNVLYKVQGGNSGPVDVPPVNGEPTRTGSLGEEYNPRDGVVTLLAITAGTEAWTDMNDNGERDSTEPFEDVGEPFLDINDNGTYDPGEDYWDTDQDGEYTGPNGQFDADTMIAAQAKVIWTGELREAADAARIDTTTANTALANGGQMNLEIWLLDKHMNPIATYLDADDSAELTDSSDNLNFTPESPLYLNERLGMRFDENTGGIMEFYYNDGCTLNAGCYQVNAADSSSSVEDPPLNFIITVTLYTTPGPQGTDWLTQEQSWFVQNITGTTE
jgi:hypothetical protein